MAAQDLAAVTQLFPWEPQEKVEIGEQFGAPALAKPGVFIQESGEKEASWAVSAHSAPPGLAGLSEAKG